VVVKEAEMWETGVVNKVESVYIAANRSVRCVRVGDAMSCIIAAWTKVYVARLVMVE
jgi:hypothetical protein